MNILIELRAMTIGMSSIIDSIGSYKNYSKSRIEKIQRALSILEDSVRDTTTKIIEIEKNITSDYAVDLLDVFILKEIFSLIAVEKSKKIQLKGFDHEVKMMLDQTQKNHLDYQVGLNLAARIAKTKNNTILGYDDLLVEVKNGLKFSFECKRPEFERNINSSIKSAISQLQKKNYADYGVIVLSLDNLIENAVKIDLGKKYEYFQNLIKSMSFDVSSYMIGIILTSNHINANKVNSEVNFNIITGITLLPILNSKRSKESADVRALYSLIEEIKTGNV